MNSSPTATSQRKENRQPLEAALRINLGEITNLDSWRRLHRRAKVKVLFVTDSSVANTQTVFEFLNGKRLGCTTFEVHRAVYQTGGTVQINEDPDQFTPHYSNFHFASEKPGGGLVLDDYHVMFIFAVFTSASIPSGELRAVHGWMNDGGGVFATGDHEDLGAHLCDKIPRVGTMRRWRTSETPPAPPVGGLMRIDTNQPDPTNPGHLNGNTQISNNVQSDRYPQDIIWIPDRIERNGLLRVSYPHEVLCHPTLGPIDVMPDHPHEGECVEPSKIDLEALVEFTPLPDYDADEYPLVDGRREPPQIIARGRTSSDYPNLAKGPVNAQIFDMISVYDGHAANVGRVAVDSTWHHWYDMNVDQIAAAGGDNWDKISRYFLNLARYLTPRGVYRSRCWFDIIDAQFRYPFDEEHLYLDRFDDLVIAGSALRQSLRRLWGPCGVGRFIHIVLCDTHPWLCRLMEERLIPRFDPEIPDRPDFTMLPRVEAIESAVLGGMVAGTVEIRNTLRSVLLNGKKVDLELSGDDIEKAAKSGIDKGVNLLVEQVEKACSEAGELFLKQAR